MNKNQVALAFGGIIALIHAIWVLAIAITPEGVKAFIDWILGLHFLAIPFTITPFAIGPAVTLVVMTFIYGYIIGWVFMAILGWVTKR